MKWIPPVVIAGILTVMTWLAAENDHWRLAYSFTGQKSEYYNLLVDGFLDGHLYMKAPVHPDLLDPDPAVRQRAPFLLDASLYHGRYYLYFGVVPAALVFLPYSVLTGQDLSGNAAGLLMVALGFNFSSRVFRDAKHRYFPGLSTSLEIICLLLLGFATATPILLVSAGGVYEEAIAGTYACLSAALWCLFRAFHSDRRSGMWLGLASLGSGLAVGCRPTFVVALPAILGAAAYLAWRNRHADGSLYPPRWHPFFRGWTAANVETLKTTARVWFDGKEILQGRFQFYDAPPSWVSLGRNPGGTDRSFSGRIHDVPRLPPRDPDTLGLFAETGSWRLEIEFPFNVPRLDQPLIASGVAGHGNLLLVEVLDGQTIRFGFDQWGAGITYSPALEIAGSGPHRLEVFIGAQVVRQKLPAAWRIASQDLQASASLLRVWLDGRPVWTTSILANADSYDLVSVGSNPQGFSTAATFYSGTLKRVAFAPEELRRFLENNFRESRQSPP